MDCIYLMIDLLDNLRLCCWYIKHSHSRLGRTDLYLCKSYKCNNQCQIVKLSFLYSVNEFHNADLLTIMNTLLTNIKK